MITGGIVISDWGVNQNIDNRIGDNRIGYKIDMSKTILNRNRDVEIKGIKSDFFKIASEYKYLQS